VIVRCLTAEASGAFPLSKGPAAAGAAAAAAKEEIQEEEEEEDEEEVRTEH
jgi:ribosomal protein L12E/L44/L45/RPP1/RPP2